MLEVAVEHDSRIKKLEDRQLEIEKSIAEIRVELKHVNLELENLVGGVNKLVLTILTTGAGAFVIWIINGGLAR